MKEHVKRIALYCAGWGFIVLGILGLFLPVLQGILFLLIGLYLLSTVSPRAARLLLRLRARYPNVSRKFDEARVKARDVQARIFKRASGAAGE